MEANGSKRWWVRWYGKNGGFELHRPWWISGFEAGGKERDIFCAAIIAPTEAHAMAAVLDAHDDTDPDVEFSFVEPRADDWSPFGDRFTRADWMRWPA